jgi:hypothetical protein
MNGGSESGERVAIEILTELGVERRPRTINTARTAY